MNAALFDPGGPRPPIKPVYAPLRLL